MKKNKLIQGILLSALTISSLTLATLSTSANAQITTSQVSASESGKPSLAPVVEKVLPSVVSINVKATEKVTAGGDNFFSQIIPREFQELLGNGFSGPSPQRERNVRYEGSGVIIDAERGYIVTNYHVVHGAKLISIKLSDNRMFNAKVVGTDPDTDLAVLKIENFKDLKQLSFTDSNKAQIGDYVIAVGNPFGIGLTVTSGIISATNRNADLNVYDNYIQTDASINSGNSGGALVDLNGNLVGINSAILSRSGGSVGIGFAIPANIVKSIATQIIETGHVSRGRIGIRGNNLNAQLVQQLKLSVNEGAFISEVLEGSPADKGGLKAGDVIVALNDQKIVDFNQLRALVGSLPANTQFKLKVVRQGQEITLTLTSEARNQQDGVTSSDNNHNSVVNFLGTNFTEVNGQVIVDSIDNNSLIARNGIKKGDILTGFGRNQITSLNQLEELIEQKDSDVIVLRFRRDNREIFITLSNN